MIVLYDAAKNLSAKTLYGQNIVIDLEFTPAPNVATSLRFEVIQVGAVRVDAGGRKIDSFCRMVRPEYATEISDTVRRLTGITWSDVSDAHGFSDVMRELTAWIDEGANGLPTRVVAWSGNDRAQMEAECAAKGAEAPMLEARWMDLQRVFPRVMGGGQTPWAHVSPFGHGVVRPRARAPQ